MKQRLFSHAVWLLASSVCLVPTVVAAECSASSGAHSVALLELYTSEGCSSCPSADRWLSKIQAQGYSSERVIPLGLHVDYWDYIGWQDRFAKPAFSTRQREQAGLNGSTFVYTPQLMLNGKDFRGWASTAKFEEEIAAINRSPSRATIKLALKQMAGAIEINVAAQTVKQDDPVLYIAIYESDLVTAVKAGENSGAMLHHDYVVREWLGPYLIDDKLATLWRQKVTMRADWKSKNMGAVAFVQSRTSGEVLQAIALKLCAQVS